MLAALPLLCLAFTVLALRARGAGLREALLDGAVLVGAGLALASEALGAVRLFSAVPIALAWIAGTAAAAALWWRARKAGLTPALPRPKPWDVPLLLVPAAAGAVTLACALLSAPNNWDSMTYHLARVAHWLSAGSLAHYPSSIQRQVYMPPFAELALAHAQALSGGDRFAGLVQWLAFAGALAGVSLIARRLGGDRQAQLLAPAIAATAPMAILQASSTQNDLVEALWLVAMADALLRLRTSDARRDWLALGGALGLALLTKGSGYPYALPFLAWLAVAKVRRKAWASWRLAGAAALVTVALNAGFWIRNVRTFDAPLGPGREGEKRLLNDAIGPGSFFSGAVRNGALHLGGLDLGEVDRTSAAIADFLRRRGLDPNDRKTTWDDDFRVPSLSTHEDWAGNRAHLFLYGAALLALAALAALRPDRRAVLPWLLCVLGGFLLFAGLFKWQLWHSRIHTPLFVLFAPAAAVALAALPWRPAHALAAAGLLYLANPWLLSNTSKPLWARAEYSRNPTVVTSAREFQYFINRTDLPDRYRRVVACLKSARCDRIGLLAGENDWEYPLWVMLGGPGAVRIQHLEVANPTARTPGADPAFEPCALVAIGRAPADARGMVRRDGCGAGDMSVYLR